MLRSIADGLEWARPGPERTPSEESLRTERMLWAFAHGYASLLIEGHGPPQTNGRPELDVLDVMPVFHYRDLNIFKRPLPAARHMRLQRPLWVASCRSFPQITDNFPYR